MSDPIQTDADSLIIEPVDIMERLDLARVFSSAQPLEVELGSGDGSFLLEWAREHPGRNFIGVERLLGRLRKLDRKGRRAGLTNLRCVRLEAWYFTQYMLPAGSAEALHIYFPDPWPKRRHHKNRLINERFPGAARQALVAGGAVYLRTDDTNYFARMKEVFGASGLFSEVETPGALAGCVTDFEREFIRRGTLIYRAAYTSITGP